MQQHAAAAAHRRKWLSIISFLWSMDVERPPSCFQLIYWYMPSRICVYIKKVIYIYAATASHLQYTITHILFTCAVVVESEIFTISLYMYTWRRRRRRPHAYNDFIGFLPAVKLRNNKSIKCCFFFAARLLVCCAYRPATFLFDIYINLAFGAQKEHIKIHFE